MVLFLSVSQKLSHVVYTQTQKYYHMNLSYESFMKWHRGKRISALGIDKHILLYYVHLEKRMIHKYSAIVDGLNMSVK